MIDLSYWRRRYQQPGAFALSGLVLIGIAVSETLTERALWDGTTLQAEIVEIDLWEGRHPGDVPECHVRYRYRAERGIFSPVEQVNPEWCRTVRTGDVIEIHYSRARPYLSRPHDRYLLRPPGQYVPFLGLGGVVLLLLAYAGFSPRRP